MSKSGAYNVGFLSNNYIEIVNISLFPSNRCLNLKFFKEIGD